MRLRQVSTLALAGLLLLVPFAVVTSSAAALVQPVSTRIATVLTSLVQGLSADGLSADGLSADAIAAEAEQAADVEDPTAVSVVAVGVAAAKAPRRLQPRPVAKQPSNVVVSASEVLRLAETTARPLGRFVKKTPERPAGLRLSGVSALGIGLQEGDILIEALGAPAQSSGAIIGAIIAARADRARYLAGKVWRHGQTFQITVEQPY